LRGRGVREKEKDCERESDCERERARDCEGKGKGF